MNEYDLKLMELADALTLAVLAVARHTQCPVGEVLRKLGTNVPSEFAQYVPPPAN